MSEQIQPLETDLKQSVTESKPVLIAEDLAFKVQYPIESESNLKSSIKKTYSFWLKCICNDMLGVENLKLITKRASIEYVSELFPFQTIKAELNTKHIKQASLDLDIRFMSESNKLIARGSQTIVFANTLNKIQNIPSKIRDKLLCYES